MSSRKLRRLPPADLLAAVVARVSDGTGVRCVLNPRDEESPLYSASLVGTRPGKSKSMFLDVYDVQLHAISAPSMDAAAVLGMVAALEEAMERDVELGCPFSVVRQVDVGVQNVKRDPTGEWHAIVAYEIAVSYGLIAK